MIANKVCTRLDGRWRSLDGRPVHAAMVALSEHYNAILADRLTASLGVTWQARNRGADRNPAWEITGVPDELLQRFSSRTAVIETAKEELIAAYVAEHGHQPSPTTVIRLRQQATLQTRPDKTVHSLNELAQRWYITATAVLGVDPQRWADQLCTRTLLQSGEAAEVDVEAVARRVLHQVGQRRSTWRRWNVHAEASRQLMGTRFTTTADRETTVARVVEAVERASIVLSPPELASVPAALRRSDGSSVLRPRHATVYTSADLLAAEQRLLDRTRNRNAPTVPSHIIGRAADVGGTHPLAADQVAALLAISNSGRTVDLLIGPAGTGKTTTMRTLRHAWEATYGSGSVIGLAPSAAAAEVLGEELGITTDNTAKWLHDHQTGNGVGLRAGLLVIIDEASMASTRTLDAITTAAETAGAKVLLAGDWAQLAAVDAGGALRLLAHDRPDVPELTGVRRFQQAWEAAASLQLRDGDPAVIDTLHLHGRLSDGDHEDMVDAAYVGWRTDLAHGRSSLLIAASRETATALNVRARTDRIADGQVDPAQPVGLHDGTQVGRGDLIVTRRNNRQLQAGRRWVRNGDHWHVTATHPDGSLTARRHNGHGRVTLPTDYVATHVELGYAVTAHRAQGATVDTTHTIIDAGMTREALYVAMTRGRTSNTGYVATDTPDHEPHQTGDTPTARTVLTSVLRRIGADPSAHEAMRNQQDRWGSIAQLAAEYETIAAAAQHHRWTTLIHQSGLTPTQAEQVLASPAFGPLTAALRRAEAHHHTPEQLLPHLIATRPLDDATDIAAILHHRLTTATTQPGRGAPPKPARLIVGLIPAADGPMPPDMRNALDQRQQLIQQRARTLLATALADQQPWIRHLGPPPANPHHRRQWAHAVQTVAVYRDRHHITSTTPLGDTPPTDATRQEAAAAQTAARAALQHRRPPPPHSPDRHRIPRRADGLWR